MADITTSGAMLMVKILTTLAKDIITAFLLSIFIDIVGQHITDWYPTPTIQLRRIYLFENLSDFLTFFVYNVFCLKWSVQGLWIVNGHYGAGWRIRAVVVMALLSFWLIMIKFVLLRWKRSKILKAIFERARRNM